MTRGKDKPGTERYRDEQRTRGGARMHGRLWHDHGEAHSMEPEYLAGADAVPEALGADERQGMGKHVGRKEKGTTRVNQPSPRGKGKPGVNKSRR
jgi:hypothetical protein